jgi:MFS family permease
LPLFLLSRVITGSFAGSSPVSKAYLADVSGDNLARNLAWRDAASTFAFLMGPLLGGVFLSTSTSLSFVIGVSSIASLLAAVVVGILVRDGPPVEARQSKKKNKQDTATKYDTSDLVSCPLGTSLWAGVATVCLISFLFNVGDSTFHAFFSALLKQRNLSASNIGLAYTSLAAISFTMSATMASRTMRRFGPVPMCAMGLTAVGTGLVAMGLGAAHVWMILAAACFYYCGVPLYSPTIPTMLLRCVPPNRRGFILGLDGAVNTVARIISPLLMGGIYKAKGPKAAFGLAGGTVLFAAMAALAKRLHVLKQNQEETNAGAVAPKKA